jgi:hypothetical protein
MANAATPNLSSILQKYPDIGRALQYHQDALNNIGQQSNASPVGAPPAPAPHVGLTVKGGGGIFDAAIDDNSPKYRGHSNFLEYSDNPSFSNAHVIHLGPSRNWRGSLGPGTFHFRSYSSYPTSPASAPIYHPAVSGEGSAAPQMQAGKGSGTSQTPGYGFGNVPYNATKPPIRG